MATKEGVVKKTDLMAYSNPRASGIIALGVSDGDKLISARLTDGECNIFLATKEGSAIRFDEKQVRPMGRTATGVTGIRMDKGDYVVGMEVLKKEGTLLTTTEHGYGKRTDTTEYRAQTRGGKGVMTIRVTEKNGSVVGITQITDDDDVMLISEHGKLIRMKAKDISVIGRATQGVRLIHMDTNEKLVSFAKIVSEDEEDVAAEPVGNA